MKTLNTIQEVHEAFFNMFLSKCEFKKQQFEKEYPFLRLQTYKGDDSLFLLRYFNQSGYFANEKTKEHYPCLILQDFAPEIDNSRNFGKESYEDNFRKIDNVLYGDIIYFPVPLNFTYQITAVAEKQSQISAVNTFFYDFFGSIQGRCFNFKIDTEDDYGVAVPYTFSITNVPREDNRYELNVDVKLKTFVHVKKAISVEALSNLTVIFFEGTDSQKTEVYREVLS